MPTSSDLYQAALIAHAISVIRFQSGLATRLVGLLNAAETELNSQIHVRLDRIGPGSNNTPRKLRKLQDQLKGIREVRSDAWQGFNTLIRKELFDFASAEVAFDQRAFAKAISLEGIALKAPLRSELRAALQRPFVGLPLQGWLNSLQLSDRRRLEQSLQLGFIEGQSTEEIITRIRGTRVNRFKDGILQISRNNVEAVVRTSATHFSNAARETLWAANSDMIIGLVWTAVLDGNTTLICQARDGKVVPLGKDRLSSALSRLKPAGARPPAHVACRSIMVAILSQNLLSGRTFVMDVRNGKRQKIDFAKIARRDKVSLVAARSRWAMDNISSVPTQTNFPEFLENQNKMFQDDLLGPARGKLFRDGKIRLERFVDESGRRYTLSELRKREAEAFQSAGF